MANAFLLRPLPIVTASSPTAATARGDCAYVANDYAGVVWQSTTAVNVNGSITLDVDLGADQVFDTIMLFGVAGVPITGTVTVAVVPSVGGNFEGSVQTGPEQPLYAGSVMLGSGGVAILATPAGVTGQNRRVRLRFLGTGAQDYVQISRVVIGRRIQLERNFSYGAAFGVRDLGSLDFSRRGVLLRARGAKLRTVALTFSSVRLDEHEVLMKPLIEQLGNTDLVALVTDPASDAQRQGRCYFGPLVGDLGLTRRTAVAYETKLNLVSIF